MSTDASERRIFSVDEEDFMWKVVIDSLKDTESVPQSESQLSPLNATFWRIAKENDATLSRSAGTYTKKFKRMWQRQEVDRLQPETIAFLTEKLGLPEHDVKPVHAATESVLQPSSTQQRDQKRDEALSLLAGNPIFEALTARNPELVSRWVHLTQRVNEEVQAMYAESGKGTQAPQFPL
ncbi:hypothetical protein QR680_006386 [Steinernema hermaphroditum]|uniref:Uncharacterized protein n=1 Tax=Steinernema hermaphroditum TaxID=289476 RepID=A0AA39HWT4_9BILA|nr:hypothetical protein QR680_006386 [Steinernema hermaphroditum]